MPNPVQHFRVGDEGERVSGRGREQQQGVQGGSFARRDRQQFRTVATGQPAQSVQPFVGNADRLDPIA